MNPARAAFCDRLNDLLANRGNDPRAPHASVHPLPASPVPNPFIPPSLPIPTHNFAHLPDPYHRSSSTSVTKPRYAESTDTVPRGFLAVPSLKDRTHWTYRQDGRLLVPCQGPSVRGEQDAFHLTEHGGYTFKLPKDFEYNNKRTINRIEKTTKQAIGVAKIAGGIAGHDVSGPADLATSALTSVQQTVDNKTRLGRAGIDPDHLFSIQFVEDNHQRRGMEELLRSIAGRKGLHNITGDLKGIVLKDGRTVWVCDECHDCLQRGVPIKETENLTLNQYKLLVKREPWVEVTLHNPASVIVFTDAFKKPSNTEKMIIHIDPTYFEACERTRGARSSSLEHLFNELGEALQGQKVLKRLEIHCNSTTRGKVYAGLQAVLQCPSLEALHVSRIACFLDGKDIPIKSRNMQELRLQGVHVDTDQAMKNLERLVKLNPGLKKNMVTLDGGPPCLSPDAFRGEPM
ncbi:hypothetical protein BGX31_010535 [Mortierella sp. GBA43]|nr:hypothetical protein BGX31_010535 [Mortierella sp. GBA43]